jgi:exodeoxyribonuclease V alpha subunit
MSSLIVIFQCNGKKHQHPHKKKKIFHELKHVLSGFIMECICCEVERVTYFDNESNCAVLRTKVKNEQVTVIGNFPYPFPGEILTLKGEWTTHPKFGRQFKALHYESKMPATVQAIKKYLGSGLIMGIGPSMAGRIVDVFGEDTLDIIESDIDRLTEVNGIGRGRTEKIRTAWDEQKAIRKVMIFLQGHDVNSTYAIKIYKEYGDRAIEVVTDNPYPLLRVLR